MAGSSPSDSTYNISILFKSAQNLPRGDIPTLQSDAYIHATLYTPSSDENKEQNPPLQFRTQTERDALNPSWDRYWHIQNVPRHGARLRIRVLDEDNHTNDDILGDKVIKLGDLSRWRNDDDNKEYKLNLWRVSKRALVLKYIATRFNPKQMKKARIKMEITVTEREQPSLLQRPYTAGPHYWSKHFSPLIGVVAGIPDTEGEYQPQRYTFEANKIQLSGPPPPSLIHKYASENRANTKSIFTKKGLKGLFLNFTLHKQYATIYSYDVRTLNGCVEDLEDDLGEQNETTGSRALAQQFLQMANYDREFRLFTYVITLDGQLRFTETGPQLSFVDLLSKHTMHANVAPYIAFAGEFFIRAKSRARPNSLDTPYPTSPAMSDAPTITGLTDTTDVDSVSPLLVPGHAPLRSRRTATVSTEPEDYELIIDNDSGTYRPKKENLGDLKDFLEKNFNGLDVIALDRESDELKELKDKQKKNKIDQVGLAKYIQPRKSKRRRVVRGRNRSLYAAGYDDGSISSGEMKRLEEKGTKESGRFNRAKEWLLDDGLGDKGLPKRRQTSFI